jgi:hypothetical protein
MGLPIAMRRDDSGAPQGQRRASDQRGGIGYRHDLLTCLTGVPTDRVGTNEPLILTLILAQFRRPIDTNWHWQSLTLEVAERGLGIGRRERLQ